MEYFNRFVIFSLISLGFAGWLFDLTEEIPLFFWGYKTAIELYLLLFCAFLVLKRVFFYRLKGNVEIVQLKERSSKQTVLLIQAAVLGLLYMVYLQNYGQLLSSNTIMIALLMLYYTSQILINNHPSVYVDAKAFAYDDYFVDQWKWKDLVQIKVEDGALSLQGEHGNFEFDFDAIDELDYVKLSEEVEASVLDGSFVEEKSSRLLMEVVQNYAQQNGVHLEMDPTSK